MKGDKRIIACASHTQAPVVFMGTPDFAVPALQTLYHHPSVHVCGVFTQPPRPKGRGQAPQPSPVQRIADAEKIPVFTPVKLDTKAIETLAALKPKLIIVAAYGLLLPPSVLDLPEKGCVNLHASLLPRWRGASPIHHAILAGDQTTGMTLMQMDQGMDTGDMLATETCPITPEDTTLTLTNKLSEKGKKLLAQHIDDLLNGLLPRQKQPKQGITYAPKISSVDFEIDWNDTSHTIIQKIKAFTPKVFFTLTKNEKPFRIRILKARTQERLGSRQKKAAGTIQHFPFSIHCQDKTLVPEILQPEGRPSMSAEDFSRGYRALLP